jgi:hypothetical protein
MSYSAFEAISTLNIDTAQLQNTGTAENPNISFATNPVFRGNIIIEDGFSVQFHDPTDIFSTNIKSGAQNFNITFTLPVIQPAAGQALISLDGSSGNLGWGDVITGPSPVDIGSIPFYADTSGLLFTANAFFKYDYTTGNFAVSPSYGFTGGGSSNSIIGGDAIAMDTCNHAFSLGSAFTNLTSCFNGGAIGGRAHAITGDRSVVIGGFSNIINAKESYALGFKSNVAHDNSFVFSDGSSDPGLQTAADNQYLFQATGGFGFVSGQMTLTSFPNNFINIYSDTGSNNAKLQYKNNSGSVSTVTLDPLTTKGDIYTFSTTNIRLAVGTNGQILSANSATSTGLEWISNSTGTVTSISAGSNITCTPNPITSTGTVALSATPSGLTSVNAGNLTLVGDTLRGTNGVLIESTGSGQAIGLSPKGASQVRIFSQDASNAVPLRFYNSAGTQYVEFKAGTLAGSTTWTWPTADVAGLMVSNGSGALSLTATPSGLTSLGVGNFTISSSTITTAVSSLNLSSVDGRVLFNTGGGNPGLGLFVNTGGFYASIGANASATGNMAFTLPATHTTNGLLVNTGSGVLAETITPSGLTSIGVGNLTLSGDTITGTNGITIQSTGSGQAIGLSPKGAAQVRIFSQDASNAVPLRFYNSASTQYVEFKAGTLSGNTTWTLPTADAAGAMVSDGSGALSLTASPKINRPIVSVSGTSKTFALSDGNTFQQCTNGSTVTLTVDTNTNVAFAVGTEIDIYQEGAGQVVIAAAGGVTIESQFSNLKIASQYTGATLKKLATNTWALVGNLTA